MKEQLEVTASSRLASAAARAGTPDGPSPGVAQGHVSEHLISTPTSLQHRIMTLIKHSPNTTIKSSTERGTTFLVKSNTPFVSAIKRIDRMFVKSKSDAVVVKGMGKAIEKTLGIGGIFDDKLGFTVNYYTGSVEVLDEMVDDDEEDQDSVYKKRMVSYVELRIRKDRKQ